MHLSFALRLSVVFDPFFCSHLAHRGAVWRPTRPDLLIQLALT